MNKMFLLITTLILTFNIFGQNLKNSIKDFKSLESSGKLPNDLIMRTGEKYKSATEKDLSKQDSKRLKKKKDEFLLKSNYMIDNLLMSGNVLFGDEVSNYVNRVVDKVLKSEPELRKELRFYVVKSNLTNAFATHQGMIFITIGLISQLENEAQLAFVLGHEINHYKKKHLINTIIESDKILSTKNKHQRRAQDTYIRKLSSYSKTLELESDSAGVYYVKKAGYDLNEILGTFDVLQFSHLPYNEIELNFTDLQTNNGKIPEELLIDSLIPINLEVNENDSRSSHPNLNKRREDIKLLIGEGNNGENYLVSESDFQNIKLLSRLESIRIDIKDLDYVRAYYHCILLKKKYPNNKYIETSYLKALYGLSKFKLNNYYESSFNDYSNFEGAISKAYYFFEKIDGQSLATLTIKKLYENKSKSDFIDKMLRDLVYNYIKSYGGEFFNFNIHFNINNTENLKKKFENKESKYTKLQILKDSLKNDTKKDIIKEYYRLIYKDYKDLNEIKTYFEDIQKDLIKDSRVNLGSDVVNLSSKEYRKSKTRLNINEVIIIDPQYLRMSDTKGVKLLNSENHKFEFYEDIKTVSNQLELNVELLAPKLCKENDVEKFNHLSICNDWIEEMNFVNDDNREFESFITSQSSYIDIVSNRYKTNNFMFTGVIEIKEKTFSTSVLAQLAFLFPYTTIPSTILFFSSNRNTYYYTYIVDSKTGKIIAENVYNLKYAKANSGNMQSYLYDNISKIKN